MSDVFMARHPLLEREVAIKVLREEWREDPEYLRRFIEDARAAHALNHPNVVRVLDVDDSQVRPFIVMDLVEGEPLDARCDGRADLLGAARIGRDIASALTAAHAAGLIHRDVKPRNVLIERRTGLAKLTDFGAAKRERASDADKTGPGKRIGTPRYMAPEQVEGREVGPYTDLFALGATLYELLAGRPAFEGQNAGAVFSAILLRQPRPLEEARPDAPVEFVELIQRLLAKRPEDRPRSAESVLLSLERLAQVILPLADLAIETVEAGALLMQAGEMSNRILILKEGALEVSRDGVRLSVVEEPGTIFGDLSALLRKPHTADVRTLRRATVYVANANSFFDDYPAVALHVARELARRLEAANERMLNLRHELRGEGAAHPRLSGLLDSVRTSLGGWIR
jgi:serine/threonine protein kinase